MAPPSTATGGISEIYNQTEWLRLAITGIEESIYQLFIEIRPGRLREGINHLFRYFLINGLVAQSSLG